MSKEERPLNLLAVFSLAFGTAGILGMYMVCCTSGLWAPLGVILGWLGLITGGLGLRHARLHGVGRAYAWYGMLLSGIHLGLYTVMSLTLAGTFAARMLE